MRRILGVLLLLVMPSGVFGSTFVVSPRGTIACDQFSRKEARREWGEKRGAITLCQDGWGEIVGFIEKKNGRARCIIRGQLNLDLGCGWLEWCGDFEEIPCY